MKNWWKNLRSSIRCTTRYGADLSRFLRERVEVVEGDVCQPGLGLAPEVSESLRKNLDLIINSSGLTDFNPDLRDALATNVDAAMNVTEFVRKSDHAGLLHLSTCYVAGARDGRVGEDPASQTTLRRELPDSMRKTNGVHCMTWSSRRNNGQRAPR